MGSAIKSSLYERNILLFIVSVFYDDFYFEFILFNNTWLLSFQYIITTPSCVIWNWPKLADLKFLFALWNVQFLSPSVIMGIVFP